MLGHILQLYYSNEKVCFMYFLSSLSLNGNGDSQERHKILTFTEPDKKNDILKVIMTVQGLDHNSGDIVTIVSVNGEAKRRPRRKSEGSKRDLW
jgi:hypothetical protein